MIHPSTSLETTPPLPVKSVGQVYALFVTTVLLIVVIGVPLQFWNVYAGLAVTEYVLILGPALAFVAWKRLPIAEALRLRPVSLALVMLSMFVGIGGNGLLVAMLELLKPLIGEAPSFGALVPKNFGDLLLVLFAGAIGAGVCEETLFRGVIQGVLSRKGRWWGILVTAVLFGAFHLNPWQFVAGLVLGIAFGFMVERAGSLVPAMVAHASANATGFTLAYVFRDRPETFPAWLPWTLAALFPVALWQFHRRTRFTMPPKLSSLATIPLPMPRRWVWRLAPIPVAVLVLLITLRVAGVVQTYRMATDALAPQIAKGDVALVIGARWLSDEIKPGDHVAYRAGNRTMVRRVLKADPTSVVVRDGDKEHIVPRAELRGKVVRTLHLP